MAGIPPNGVDAGLSDIPTKATDKRPGRWRIVAWLAARRLRFPVDTVKIGQSFIHSMGVVINIVSRPGPTDDADRRAARITRLAVKVFGNQDRATRWLRRPRREFGGISPLEMLETEAAARQVELLLAQLDDA